MSKHPDFTDPVMQEALKKAQDFNDFCKLNNLPRSLILDGVALDIDQHITNEERFHCIETNIYDNDGNVIKMTSTMVPGDYEFTEEENRYIQWLAERRGNEENEI